MKYTQYKSPRFNGRKFWRFDFTIGGVRIRHGGFETKSEAEQAVAGIRLQARALKYGIAMPDSGITLKELFAARINDPACKGRETEPTLKRFLKLISEKTRVKDLTRADLKKFLDSQIEKGLQPNTINRYLAVVCGCLNDAGQYFPELESWKAPAIKRLPESGSRERVLTQSEIAKLLAALTAGRQKGEAHTSERAKHEVYDLLRLMVLTGAREGELLKLNRSAFDPDSRTVQIYANKTKTTRKIPVSNLAFQILRERSSSRSRFFSITYAQLSRWFHKAGKLAKIVTGRDVAGGWVFYDLRHTAATTIEQAGIPYSTVSAILGHKRRDMTAKYTHATWVSMKSAVELLEQWCLEIDGFGCGFEENRVRSSSDQALAS